MTSSATTSSAFFAIASTRSEGVMLSALDRSSTSPTEPVLQ